jgi:hypothetical protein
VRFSGGLFYYQIFLIMGEKITDIDCMKYRKSTHLAGIDVETIIAEKGECILTIKEAYYSKQVDVSGNKTDGYFIDFVEPFKPMVLNSVNRKTIANIVKTLKNVSSTDSRNIGNWIGIQIELSFDPTVKMMGQVVGGIRIKPISPVPQISDVNAINILGESTTLSELQSNWSRLTKQEQSLPSVTAKKDALKTQLNHDKSQTTIAKIP